MQAYAKEEGGTVVGVWVYPEGVSDIPSDLIQCPAETGPGWTYDSATEVFSPPVAPIIPDAELKQLVKRERDRRLAQGFVFAGKTFQWSEESKVDIVGSSTAALAAMIANPAVATDLKWHGGSSNFKWICADNTYMEMDAQTMVAFGNTALAHRSAHIFAADALRNLSPIPQDYQDDSYWP